MGMLLALISPFTLFLIAPLALLLSLNGMRRAPRGIAFIGLIFSMIATSILSLGIIKIASERHAEAERYQARIVAAQESDNIRATMETLETVEDELRDYRASHDHRLPGLNDGMLMAVGFVDAWEKELMYGVTEDGCIVRSAGPDGEFSTPDDLTVKLDGNPDEWSISNESSQ